MEGRVLTVDGFPAAGIRVTLKVAQVPEDTTQYYSEDVRSVTTSHLGTYRLHGIPAGRYHVTAGQPGLLTYFPGVLSVSDAELFVVADGTVLRHDFKLACRLDLKVSGRVIFPSENSWREPTVGLISKTNLRRHRKVKPDGSFEFTEVPPGSYTLSCGVLPSPVAVTVTDQDVSGIELRPLAMIPVTIAVEMEERGPIPEVSLLFKNDTRSYGYTPPAKAMLAEGEYSVVPNVNQLLYPGLTLKSIRCDSTDLLQAPLRIAATDVSKSVEVRLVASPRSPWVLVSGRVIDQRGKGTTPELEELVVELRASRDNLTALVQSDGTFEFSRVLPRKYVLWVKPKVDHTKISPNLLERNQTLDVRHENVTGVSLVLPRVHTLTCRVEVEGEGPMPASPCLISDREGRVFRTESIYSTVPGRHDADFRLHLPEGDIECFVRAPGREYVVRSVKQGTRNLRTAPVRAASDSEEVRILLGPAEATAWVRVHGRLNGIESSPEICNAATVRLGQASGNSQSVPVKAGGAFGLSSVAPGGYRLTVTVPFHEEPGFFRAAEGDWMVTLPVMARNGVGEVIVALPRHKRTRGRIKVESGHPLPNFHFAVSGPCAMSIYTAIGPDGSFFAELPEGNVWISVEGLPRGYAVRSFTYGSADLLDGPFQVTALDIAELQLAFAVVSPLKTLRVRGRVVGLEYEHCASVPHITVTGAMSERRSLDSNGEFEFQQALPYFSCATQLVAASYSARCELRLEPLPEDEFVTDLGVTLVAIRGRVETLEGNSLPSTIPLFRIPSAPYASYPSAMPPSQSYINLQADGSFIFLLCPGEWKLHAQNRFMPADTFVKSIRYGSIDALNNPFTVDSESPAEELLIVVAARAVNARSKD
jgi:hypothetical protein